MLSVKKQIYPRCVKIGCLYLGGLLTLSRPRVIQDSLSHFLILDFFRGQ